MCATFYEVPSEKKVDGNYKAVPIGKPVFNTHIVILDNNLQLMPAGIGGELYVGGLGLARGYFDRPDLTAEKFIANPFITDEEIKQGINTRLYKTGDLCRWLPDGNIEYLEPH